MRGIRANAWNAWMIALSENKDRILNCEFMTQRWAIVEELSEQVFGIGEVVVCDTMARIEEFINRGYPEDLDPFGSIFEIAGDAESGGP